MSLQPLRLKRASNPTVLRQLGHTDNGQDVANGAHKTWPGPFCGYLVTNQQLHHYVFPRNEEKRRRRADYILEGMNEVTTTIREWNSAYAQVSRDGVIDS